MKKKEKRRKRGGVIRYTAYKKENNKKCSCIEDSQALPAQIGLSIRKRRG
jgi:hypothetical protein